MKAYIINFNPLALPTHELLGYIDNRHEVLNWYLPFAGTIMIVSNYNHTALANVIANDFPMHHFLITECNVFNTDGRLLNPAWEFIRTPKSSGRWDSLNYSGLAGLLGLNIPPKT
jgi:hypothetical protein